jgi:hypothetical protein
MRVQRCGPCIDDPPADPRNEERNDMVPSMIVATDATNPTEVTVATRDRR